jgi:hypothetical protein
MVEIERQKASLIAEIDRARAAFRSATTELNASLDVGTMSKNFVAKHSWQIVGVALGTGVLAALIGSRAQPLAKIGASVVTGTAGAAKAGVKALLFNTLLSAAQPAISRLLTEKLTAILKEKSPDILNLFTKSAKTGDGSSR